MKNVGVGTLKALVPDSGSLVIPAKEGVTHTLAYLPRLGFTLRT